LIAKIIRSMRIFFSFSFHSCTILALLAFSCANSSSTSCNLVFFFGVVFLFLGAPSVSSGANTCGAGRLLIWRVISLASSCSRSASKTASLNRRSKFTYNQNEIHILW
jgi:hypothetical protein